MLCQQIPFIEKGFQSDRSGCQCNHYLQDNRLSSDSSASDAITNQCLVWEDTDLNNLDRTNTFEEPCSQSNEHFDLDIVLNSLKTLLGKYSSQLGAETMTQPLIVSGGLQQYMNRKLASSKCTTHQPRKGDGSEVTTFHDLPVSFFFKDAYKILF